MFSIGSRTWQSNNRPGYAVAQKLFAAEFVRIRIASTRCAKRAAVGREKHEKTQRVSIVCLGGFQLLLSLTFCASLCFLWQSDHRMSRTTDDDYKDGSHLSAPTHPCVHDVVMTEAYRIAECSRVQPCRRPLKRVRSGQSWAFNGIFVDSVLQMFRSSSGKKHRSIGTTGLVPVDKGLATRTKRTQQAAPH